MKSAFDKIAVGLKDAIAHAQGDESRGRVHVPKSRAQKPKDENEPGAGSVSGNRER